MDVKKISSSNLRRAPFFFLLASEPDNFVKKRVPPQTELDLGPAVCQAADNASLSWGKKEKRNYFHFLSKIQRREQNSTSCLLLCLQMWQVIRRKRLQAARWRSPPVGILPSLAHDHLLYLWRESHITLLEWQLTLTASSCYLCGVHVIYSHLRRNDWLVSCASPTRNGRAISCYICKLEWSFIKLFTGGFQGTREPW